LAAERKQDVEGVRLGRTTVGVFDLVGDTASGAWPSRANSPAAVVGEKLSRKSRIRIITEARDGRGSVSIWEVSVE